MSKHTPGPWFVGETLSDRGPCIVGDGDSVVCEFSGRAGASLDADASLIAASPDLLAFAQEIASDYASEDGPANPKYYAKRAFEVIAKAKGAA